MLAPINQDLNHWNFNTNASQKTVLNTINLFLTTIQSNNWNICNVALNVPGFGGGQIPWGPGGPGGPGGPRGPIGPGGPGKPAGPGGKRNGQDCGVFPLGMEAIIERVSIIFVAWGGFCGFFTISGALVGQPGFEVRGGLGVVGLGQSGSDGHGGVGILMQPGKPGGPGSPGGPG